MLACKAYCKRKQRQFSLLQILCLHHMSHISAYVINCILFFFVYDFVTLLVLWNINKICLAGKIKRTSSPVREGFVDARATSVSSPPSSSNQAPENFFPIAASNG